MRCAVMNATIGAATARKFFKTNEFEAKDGFQDA
jgi:hypothetical protein